MSTLLRADQREVWLGGADLCMRKRILSPAPEGGKGRTTERSRNVWSTHSAENTSGNVVFSSYIFNFHWLQGLNWYQVVIYLDTALEQVNVFIKSNLSTSPDHYT